MEWSEAEYVEYLLWERRRFAWVVRRHGDLASEQAEAAALERYTYEPPDDEPYRGLIFHDEAWSWAMRSIYGESYWRDHPDLARPPMEYEDLE